jgi:hypothetical protein
MKQMTTALTRPLGGIILCHCQSWIAAQDDDRPIFGFLTQEVEAFAKSARVSGARTLLRMGTSMRAMRRRMSSSGL